MTNMVVKLFPGTSTTFRGDRRWPGTTSGRVYQSEIDYIWGWFFAEYLNDIELAGPRWPT
jgi:hypothetical protein